MLVVFQFYGKDDFEEFLHVVKHKNDVQNEDLEYCLGREKAQEVIACRELNIPYVVLAKPDLFARRNADNSHKIIDSNVDVSALNSDTRLVVRVNARHLSCEALDRFQPLVSTTATQDIAHWPRIIQYPEKYLRRNVTELSAEAFNEAMQTKALNPPLFIKGVEKGNGFSLHQVAKTRQELDDLIKSAVELRQLYGDRVPDTAKDDDYLAFKQMPDWECPYRGPQKGRVYFFEPKDGVMISDVLQFDHKPDHKAEYRCFIVDGKVSSISTYTDYTAHPVPACIAEMAREFAADHAALAPAFVVDFGMTDQGPVLVELNSFSESGRYVGNDAFALYRDLEALLGVDRTHMKEPDVAIPENQEGDLMLFDFDVNENSNTLDFKRREVGQADEDVFGLG